MSIKSEVLDALLAAGASAEMIVAAVKADMAEDEARREAKRANNAERQQRFRDKRKSRKNNARNALRSVTPPIDNNHTPSDISPDGESHTQRDDAQAVLDHWRDTAKPLGLSCWSALTAKRRKTVNARLREHGLEAIRMAIEHVPKSAFLRGEAGDWNGANMDFLMRQDAIPRILEGKYDDRSKATARFSEKPRDGFAAALDDELAEHQPSQPSGQAGRYDAGPSPRNCIGTVATIHAMR